MKKKITGEYESKGEYHKKLDKDWPYLPVYLAKMEIIKRFLSKNKGSKILDAGCGEGVLVDEYKEKGFNIIGLDLNYSSKNVKKGNLLKMPFKKEEFDVILCLDVLEHMDVLDQEKAIREIYKITKKNGIVVFGLPNLAHFASRCSFLLTGKLIRTSEIERHKGDRPIKEYLKMIKNSGFTIVARKGIFPTFPIISFLTIKSPSKSIYLHKIYNKIFSIKGICFENLIFCKK